MLSYLTIYGGNSSNKNENTLLRRPRPLELREDLTDFGEHFSEWQRLQNLSVAVVTKRSNVSESTIARIECGHGASLENILRIARTLGILELIVKSIDPWEDDRGRLLALSQFFNRAGSK